MSAEIFQFRSQIFLITVPWMTDWGHVMVVNILLWVYDLSSNWEQSSSPGIIGTITQKASGGDASRPWCRQEKKTTVALVEKTHVRHQPGNWFIPKDFFQRTHVWSKNHRSACTQKRSWEMSVCSNNNLYLSKVNHACLVNELHKSGNTMEDYVLIIGWKLWGFSYTGKDFFSIMN